MGEDLTGAEQSAYQTKAQEDVDVAAATSSTCCGRPPVHTTDKHSLGRDRVAEAATEPQALGDHPRKPLTKFKFQKETSE